MRNIPQDLVRDKVYCVSYLEYFGEKGIVEYCYIAVKTEDLEKFNQALIQGDFSAEDYGVILDQGEGKAPSYVKEKMQMMYGCEH